MGRAGTVLVPGKQSATSAGRTEWHRLSPSEVALRVGGDLQRGLDARTAARRLAAYGPNLLPEGGGPSPWAIVVGQFGDVMVLILIAAAGLSLVFGEFADAVAIGTIVLLNAALGAVQELRAERSLASLRRLMAPVARVLREGRVREIPAAQNRHQSHP